MVVSPSQLARTSRVLTERKMSNSAVPAGSAASVSFVTVTDRVRSWSRWTTPRFAGAIEMVALPASAAAGSATWLLAADTVAAEA